MPLQSTHGGGSHRNDDPLSQWLDRNKAVSSNNIGNTRQLITSLKNSGSGQVFYPTETTWDSGDASNRVVTGALPDTEPVSTKVVIPTSMGKPNAGYYTKTERSETSGEEFKRIVKATSSNIWSDNDKRNELLKENQTLIQNNYSYPYYIKSSNDMAPAEYDYQIIPGDPRYPTMVTLEDKLKEARASLGIHVHGNNDIARAVKYNMYNRFKVPDHNLAFNKMTTHVFFTRPDLNLLDCYNGSILGPVSQIKNHSDTSLLYKMNPYLFRLLTDFKRCGDNNNFNMLLSQQVTSFDIMDEELSTTEVGKSWNGNSMMYGDSYSGKSAGDFSCSFTELQDLSIIMLMKLWITYIANVSTGAWSPSYDLHGSFTHGLQNMNYSIYQDDSYAYTRTLDYAASVYVFKCAPNGEDVLYWTKYFGVFPTSTGSSALSWDIGTGIGESPKLNIKFKYCYKRDMSPVSLVEFNALSGVNYFNRSAEASFNPNYGHSSRPFVGAPFVELAIPYDGGTGALGKNADMFGKPRAQVKLKFLQTADARLSDDLLYRSGASSNKYVKI